MFLVFTHAMSDDAFARRRRPRPVAEMPPAELADGRDLAKGWLLELIAGTSLTEAGDLPTGAMAQDGPALCAAVLGALGDDAALARIEAGGEHAALAAGAARLAGARDPARVVAAVEGLRRAAWELLQPAALAGPPGLTADLAARLGHVCALVATAAIAETAGASAPGAAAPAPAGGSVLPDVPGGFAVHDLRVPAADALTVAITQRVAVGQPFSLLAVEVDDLERLIATQRGREVALGLESVEEAVRAQLGPADLFARERVGRAWVLSGGEGRALGERIAGAVVRTAPVHGTPLTVSVGLACFPDDGRTPEDLLSRADEGLFAARAAGVPLA